MTIAGLNKIVVTGNAETDGAMRPVSSGSETLVRRRCACGCRRMVTPPQRFIHSHNIRWANPKPAAFHARLHEIAEDEDGYELVRDVARKAFEGDVPRRKLASEIGFSNSALGAFLNGGALRSFSLARIARWLGIPAPEALRRHPPNEELRKRRRATMLEWQATLRNSDGLDVKVVTRRDREDSGKDLSELSNRTPPVHTGPKPILQRQRMAIKAAIRQLPGKTVDLCVGCGKATTLPPQRAREHERQGWRTWHVSCYQGFQKLKLPMHKLRVEQLNATQAGRWKDMAVLKRKVLVYLLHRVLGFTLGELRRAGVAHPDKDVARAEEVVPVLWENLFPHLRKRGGEEAALKGQPIRLDWFDPRSTGQKRNLGAGVTLATLLARTT